jgi:hypothetical protein
MQSPQKRNRHIRLYIVTTEVRRAVGGRSMDAGGLSSTKVIERERERERERESTTYVSKCPPYGQVSTNADLAETLQ